MKETAMSGTTSDSTCQASTPPGEVSAFTWVGDEDRVSTEAVIVTSDLAQAA
jgi:hypothetical protein